MRRPGRYQTESREGGATGYRKNARSVVVGDIKPSIGRVVGARGYRKNAVPVVPGDVANRVQVIEHCAETMLHTGCKYRNKGLFLFHLPYCSRLLFVGIVFWPLPQSGHCTPPLVLVNSIR